jgi:hypothetical protein
VNNNALTFDVNEELVKIRAAANTVAISGISKISSVPAINLNSSPIDKHKASEARELIQRYARSFSDTEENIEEYIKDQLESYPLDDLINCFRLLNADIQNSQPSSANVANVANEPFDKVTCSNCKYFEHDERGFNGIGAWTVR